MIGIVLHVKNVVIGENGIVIIVINVCISYIISTKLISFYIGTYGTTLPCERCGGEN